MPRTYNLTNSRIDATSGSSSPTIRRSAISAMPLRSERRRIIRSGSLNRFCRLVSSFWMALKLIVSSIVLGLSLGAPTSCPNNAEEPPLGPGCGICDKMKVWNDVVFMFDSTESAVNALQDNWGLIVSVLAFFNVQTSNSTDLQSLRVGIVVYSDTVQVVAPLGSIDGGGVANISDLPYLGGGTNGANMEAAYNVSIDQLEKYGRPNARKVIVTLAVDANIGDDNDAQQIVHTFIENLGISIMYEYLPEHGLPNPKLELLASPGYFLMSTNTTYTDFEAAICDANCFCTTNWKPLTVSGPRLLPTEGCYYPIETPANYAFAARNCDSHYMPGSYLATDRAASKSAFLTGMLNTQVKTFYLGMQLNATTSTWQWADGYPVDGDYQPWSTSPAPTNPANGLCATFSNSTQMWDQLDCRIPNLYICETQPCSSHLYCAHGFGSSTLH